MRITTLILITTLLQVSAATFGQKITIVKNNIALKEVFREIRKQTGYNVLWQPDKVDAAKKLDLQLKNEDLDKALDVILKDQNLSYSIDDKTVRIKYDPPTFLERVAATLSSSDVRGRVVDAQGAPLPGATVKVKATGKAVSTDAKGNFYLKNVEEGTMLVVSYTGYISKEVRAAKEMGSVALEVSLSKLDEVQVIAYGTTTQRLSTGNVTTIKADVIEKQPVNNPLLALQGRVPGLFVEQATGFAGSGVKVRIQGTNSWLNGSDPLYVIDGVPYSSQLLPGGNPIVGGSGGKGDSGSSMGNPMNFINPANIESIDILKDADATAIYGSRAANGAILITTKKGKAGDVKVGFNLQSGWSKVPHKLALMNSQQYLEMRREAFKNDGLASVPPDAYINGDLNGNWDTTRYTDWQKELIGKTASYQDLNASVSGGNDRTTFFISAGHHRETNVFPGEYSDRKTSVNFNINTSSTNQKFKMQFSGGYLFNNNQLPNVDLTEYAMTLAPIAPPLYQVDGSINWAINEAGMSTFASNPVGYLSNSYLSKTNNLISNMVLSYQIIRGMNLKSSFGYNKLSSDITKKIRLESVSPEFRQYSARTTTFINNDLGSWLIEPQLEYSCAIGPGKLEMLIGTTFRKETKLGTTIGASGFSNDLVMDDPLSAIDVNVISSINSTYKYNAVFGRINYNWQDKYILNLTGRRDGSSRFGPNSQFHNFAALAGAWIFSNENFIKDHLELLSFGKIRASYGTTGSDQIPEYQFLSLYSPLQQNSPYQGIITYQPSRLTNPNLEWEETRKIQFGLDLGFFKDRIIINANYYRNRSSNQLTGYTLPLTTGFNSITTNKDAKIENRGWELTLSSTNLAREDIKWSSSINLTILKTLLKYTPDTRFFAEPVIGEPLTSMRVFHYLGVDPSTGIYQFEDKNGNPTSSPDYLDRTILLDLAPKFYGGIQNSFSYKGFQLDFLLSFVKQIAQNSLFTFATPGTKGNQLVSILERWQKQGDISTVQRFTTDYGPNIGQYIYYVRDSDAAWTDASYIRLKNISLSWKLPQKWCNNIRLHNGSLFLQGQNILTITNYKGLDPETRSSAVLPVLRTITVGLMVAL